MKITFRHSKNALEFLPKRTTIFSEELDIKSSNKLNPIVRKILYIFICILTIGLLFIKSVIGSCRVIYNKFIYIGFTKPVIFITWILIILITSILLLILHELCHVLYGVLTKRKINAICFLPYDFRFFAASAFVFTESCPKRKFDSILMSLFPMILLTFVPIIIMLFLGKINYWLFTFANMNIVCSYFDILNVLCTILYVPNGSFLMDDAWFLPSKNKTTFIYRINVDGNFKLSVKEWKIKDNKVIAIDQLEENEKVSSIIEEIKEQFYLNKKREI